MAGGASRHSTGQPEIGPAELPAAIRAAVEELRVSFPAGEVRCLHWNEHYVAAAMDVAVDLPSRGPVADVDIRAVEPVLLLLHRRRYPWKAPIAYSDRKDFPAARLPHLNPTGIPELASLCLHRGSLDDWFAEHSISDMVERVRGWLRDAASERLIRETDRFEGTRIEDPVGIMVYGLDSLIARVEERWTGAGGPGWCYLMVTLLRSVPAKEFLSSRISYRVNFALPERPSGSLVDLFRRYNHVVGEEPQEDRLLFGLLLWGPRTPVVDYFGVLPSSYGELRQFCQRLDIGLDAAVEDYRSLGAQLLGGVPLIVAVPRPQPLIGARSTVELLHFTVLASEEHSEPDGNWKDAAPVLTLSHRTPLTVAFAREMSRDAGPAPSPILIVGCGAVGSKLSLHLARAGHAAQALIDPADLSPHHLVRHGLAPDDVGKNKAEQVAARINSMYRLDQANLNVRAYPLSVFDLADHGAELPEGPVVIDATASTAVLNALTAAQLLPPGGRYARCEIADEGRLGILTWEGPGRNPRLDDLQAFLFDLGRQEPSISRWLRAHQQAREQERAAALEEIGIGLSCSSTTLRLADDAISFHASLFSTGLRCRDQWIKEPVGRVQLSLLDVTSDVGAAAQTFAVRPVMVLAAREGKAWQVRIQDRVPEKIALCMRAAGRKETGGLLLGFAHRKRRVIYVTDVLPPSRDSKGTPYAFKRGVKDYPAILDAVQARTGGLVGYVGEWHSHPTGDARLSPTDLKAVMEIRRHLDAAGLPTHIMVWGRSEVASYVFGGG